MKRTALLIAISLLVASCATMGQSGSDQVSRAATAAGGVDKLAAVKTLYVKGTVKHWEPEQSQVAGGEARFAADSIFEAVTDVDARTTSIDWSRKFSYPSPGQFVFTETVTPDVGYVSGIDSSGRTKQSLEAKPPAHNMSSLRLAATQRELRRTSPLLLLEMHKNPAQVSASPDVTVAGVGYPAVTYRPAANQSFIVMFDRTSGLPARIRTLDYDNIWGDVTYDLVLGDWKDFDGVRVATSQRYELSGRTVADIKLTQVGVNASFASDRLGIPDGFQNGSKPAMGDVPYQWVIRRQFIGVYLDSEVPSFDTRASTGLRLVQLAPGVQHVVGGSHNSLIVEMKDHLVVFDAPVSDWQSVWLLGAAQVKYTGKPVKYLVLTHHHMDHAGGIRAYAADGATLVVGKGTAEHYRRVLAAPFTRNPDLPAKDLSKTPIVEVADKHVLTDGEREVHAYIVANNPHADGLLIGYVPQAKLGFVTDIWIPGAGPLPDKLTPPLAAFVGTVKKAGITVEKFAGGHGSTADYAPLAALEGK
jgi:glyoxylase-like metal-dependent hydrolase (beta-lactamase superfamily II)/predicted small secreted protein